jgi:EAL domain-containing protein (putative c-di-GMP-specific phosphodiesterase class I)
VESHAILEALTSLGCDHAQGYDVGRPTTAADLIAQLRKQHSRH